MKIKALKTFYHVYKEKLSTEQELVEKLEDQHLVIDKFEAGKEYPLSNTIGNTIFKNSDLCEVF